MRDLFKDCTVDCERMPLCEVCGKMKKPIGRSAPLESCYCDEECLGYRQEPTPGHLWPGELADIRAVEK
jgi:hypothetical protein